MYMYIYMLKTLDYTIRIGSIPTFLYFDLYLYSAYAAHFIYIYVTLRCVVLCTCVVFCYVLLC